MSRTSRGVLYLASREPYLEEAVQSARSVRNHNPDLPITLYAPPAYDAPAVFDEVRRLEDPDHDFSDSNVTPDQLPYDRTLFLDSDTYVTGSLEPVFDVLETHDLAAAQDPTRTGTVAHSHDHDVPATFPQYNTGVLALRDAGPVHDLLTRWHALYHDLESSHGLNQPAFRVALYESDAALATLPPEYNFRIGNVANSVLYACGPVRILHGRSMHWDLPEAAAQINATDERRAVVAKPHPELITDGDRSVGQTAAHMADRARWKFTKDGVSGVARGAAAVLKGVVRS